MGDCDSSSTATSLAPGFRFHPTDEELVYYYLKRKVCGKPFRFDAISDIDIYKTEPWELPGRSKLKSKDLEWYFFTGLDKKYGNGSRTNRATEEGYWKTTGKDRPVYHRCCVVGMKKTLVYHHGRAPRGERTNWVMHEYRLTDEDLAKAGFSLETFVLCRIFQKSGSGPKNGERYGAPFVDEEWELDDMLAQVPGRSPPAAADCLVAEDLIDQNLIVDFHAENCPTAFNVCQEDSVSNVEDSSPGNDQKPVVAPAGETQCYPELSDDLFDPSVIAEFSADTGKIDTNNYWYQSSTNCVPGQPGLCPEADNAPPSGLFVETNDLFAPFENFGDGDDIFDLLNFDDHGLPNTLMDNQDLYNKTELIPPAPANQQFPTPYNSDAASSSMPVMEVSKSKTEPEYPFINRMLGNIPAPPAFAAEFPAKDLTARLNAASDSIRVTAGMVRLRNTAGNGMQWSLGKDGNVNVVLSFDVPESVVSPVGLDYLSGALSGKAASAVTRGWFFFFFFWVMVLAISAKIGTCIYAK